MKLNYCCHLNIRTIDYIFIIIFTMFWLICPSATLGVSCPTREPIQNLDLTVYLNYRGRMLHYCKPKRIQYDQDLRLHQKAVCKGKGKNRIWLTIY